MFVSTIASSPPAKPPPSPRRTPFRNSLLTAGKSESARLAGRGIHGKRLERKSHSEDDCNERRLSPVVQDHAGTAAKRSGESVSGSRPAATSRPRDDPGSGARSSWPAGRQD